MAPDGKSTISGAAWAVIAHSRLERMFGSGTQEGNGVIMLASTQLFSDPSAVGVESQRPYLQLQF